MTVGGQCRLYIVLLALGFFKFVAVSGGVLVVFWGKCLGAPDPNGPCALILRRKDVF